MPMNAKYRKHTKSMALVFEATWKTIVPLIKGGAVFVSSFTCVGGKNSPVVILHLFLAPCPFPSLQTQLAYADITMPIYILVLSVYVRGLALKHAGVSSLLLSRLPARFR